MKTGTITQHIGFKASFNTHFQHPVTTTFTIIGHCPFYLLAHSAQYVTGFLISLKKSLLCNLDRCLLEEDGEVCCVGPREEKQKVPRSASISCLSVADAGEGRRLFFTIIIITLVWLGLQLTNQQEMMQGMLLSCIWG